MLQSGGQPRGLMPATGPRANRKGAGKQKESSRVRGEEFGSLDGEHRIDKDARDN